MRALIMAGGAGTRLGLGEKPLVNVGGRPMISLVLSAFENAGIDILIVASSRNPYTMNWARVQGFAYIRSSGHGYINDLHETVKIIEESGPFFTCVADLPCLTAGHITQIRKRYEISGKEALSTWVPVSCKREGSDVSFVENINGVDACPVGINIIRGDLIDRPQEEEKFLIMDRHLAYNINTRADLEKVRHFFFNLTGRKVK
ncbi:MAG: NTP transferase domain-containing protein [Methanoregulaceae archaeon]|jgi:adenosylcobinamide-phosphate guanylyltransferase|nr:NTP transferase domain-containing protein [Methanoregulaceae archaeon]